ncbi:MAG TPA: hypothetical protein VK750_01805 [Cytophagaceae bacterium]|jgi:hypothetical protein|nr:hypothetical protein [Cytophagaceae bacterium]
MKNKNVLWMLSLLLMISATSWAQKKSDGYDKIVFGSYGVVDVMLKEFMISKSGEVLFTARMDKQYTHIGHIEKNAFKELMAYCNSKQWDDFVKFNPGKDYQFVRLYNDKQYVELIWAPSEADAQTNELFTKLSYAVNGFPLPEMVTVKK